MEGDGGKLSEREREREREREVGGGAGTFDYCSLKKKPTTETTWPRDLAADTSNNCCYTWKKLERMAEDKAL